MRETLVQRALESLSETYFPRASEITRLERQLNETRAKSKRLAQSGQNYAEPQKTVYELAQKVARLKAINRYVR
jgi:uncharacterized protein involved in exopolysaccharide biosynthesis